MVTGLSVAGDYALVDGTFVFIEGSEHLKNRISQRFRFFRGEWYVDERQGIPYRTQVLVDNPNLGAVEQLFREVLESTPGVKAVQKLDLSFDKATRVLTVDWEVNDGGEVPVTGQYQDFLVGGIE